MDELGRDLLSLLLSLALLGRNQKAVAYENALGAVSGNKLEVKRSQTSDIRQYWWWPCLSLSLLLSSCHSGHHQHFSLEQLLYVYVWVVSVVGEFVSLSQAGLGLKERRAVEFLPPIRASLSLSLSLSLFLSLSFSLSLSLSFALSLSLFWFAFPQFSCDQSSERAGRRPIHLSIHPALQFILVTLSRVPIPIPSPAPVRSAVSGRIVTRDESSRESWGCSCSLFALEAIEWPDLAQAPKIGRSLCAVGVAVGRRGPVLHETQKSAWVGWILASDQSSNDADSVTNCLNFSFSTPDSRRPGHVRPPIH